MGLAAVPGSERLVQLAPRLIDVTVPANPAGVAVVLHGGGSRRRTMRVSPTQVSVLRMIPVARRIARATSGRIAVVRLLNSRRGWDAAHTPVRDVDWALDEIGRRLGRELPVCLVGHSLGGRAALLCAGLPQVRGVVALAPWVDPSERLAHVDATPIVIIHGDDDRVALAGRSRRLAERLGPRTPVSYVSVTGGTHGMLHRRSAFDGLAARCVAWMLLGELQGELVRRIAAGEQTITV
jgi:pimeloyl-ACP methyl ester carboxylesterase